MARTKAVASPSKRVPVDAKTEKHGYEFGGPYVLLSITLKDIADTLNKNWRCADLLWPSNRLLCVHVSLQRRVWLPSTRTAASQQTILQASFLE